MSGRRNEQGLQFPAGSAPTPSGGRVAGHAWICSVSRLSQSRLSARFLELLSLEHVFGRF